MTPADFVLYVSGADMKCLRCGALVPYQDVQPHIDWHENERERIKMYLDEIIEAE